MKIYNLAFLLLFQLPFASPIKDSQQKLNKNKPGAVNIVFKSTDGGQTWQDISEGLPENLAGGNFFANDSGLHLDAGGNGIYHSKPNSTPPFWKKEPSPDKQDSIATGKSDSQFVGAIVWPPKYSNSQVKDIRTVLETAGGTLFIGSTNGLFRSANSGKTWKQVYTGGLVMKLVASNGVLLAASQGGILRSTDDGEHWDRVLNEGALAGKVFNLFVSLNVIYAITRNGGC
jgi:photosystem II stability/assembly factor-like uncharacterized protein